MPLDGSSSSSTARALGEHAGQVDDPAGAGRQLAHELVAVGAEAEQVDQLARRARATCCSESCTDGRCSAAAIGSRTSTCCSRATAMASCTVSAGEQAAVLERPARGPATTARASGASCRSTIVAVRSRRIVPRVGRREARDDVEQRRLAGAVGADEAEDLAGPHVERRRRRAPATPPKRRATSRTSSTGAPSRDRRARRELAPRRPRPPRPRRRRNTERSRSGRSSSSAVGPSKRISPFSMK